MAINNTGKMDNYKLQQYITCLWVYLEIYSF